ncbi:hypothetical protein L7F22_042585 [Adiantum nelumboides]|nr:hypothetical protein [Adiantum nelumboides]
MEVMGLVFQQPQAKGSSTSKGVEVVAKEEPMMEERLRKMLSKDLTKEEEEDYINMFKRYPHLFITDYSMIKGVDVIQHHIDLKLDAKPVAQKLRRLGVVQQEALLIELTFFDVSPPAQIAPEPITTQVSTSSDQPRRSQRVSHPPERFVPGIDFVLLTDSGEPSCYKEAMLANDKVQWEHAMKRELSSIAKNKTWKLVPLPKGRKALPCKWVYKKKIASNVQNYKARLVAKGFKQEYGVDFLEIFSPVVKTTTLRMLLALVAAKNMELDQMDVITIFLHGDLEEEIYMQQPEGFVQKGKEHLTTPLPAYLKLSKNNCPKSVEEKAEMAKHPYASACGSLIYAMVATRPDIAHAVGVVSRFMSNPGKKHWDAVKSICRYLSGTADRQLCYGGGELSIKGYVDSDYASCVDNRKSTIGWIYTFAGSAISWSSVLQDCTSISTTEAEYVALSEACKEAIWLACLVKDLGLEQCLPVLHCDSQSAIALAKNPVFQNKTH